MIQRQVSITTFDNPFNPFDDFVSWFLFDIEKGYFTCSRIARLFSLPELHTQKQEDEELERVIDRLIEIDPLDLYRKVVRKTRGGSD